MTMTHNDCCFVIAVNDDRILDNNFKKSKYLDQIETIILKGYNSATKAYNDAIRKTDKNYLIFVHQDVYLPIPWMNDAVNCINTLNETNPNWGVIGVAGVNRNGEIIGKLWSQGIKREIDYGRDFEEAYSVDEVLIIFNKKSNLEFDENLPGFHLYGTDIVLESVKNGLHNYVIKLPIIHNDKEKYLLDKSYWNSYCYMKKKWFSVLPISTTIVPITKYGLVFFIRQIKQAKVVFINSICNVKNKHLEEPDLKAKELGYE